MENKMEVVDYVPKFEISTQESKGRFAELQQFIGEQMVKDEDYGVIPGCKKPSLFKPGAEKLEFIMGFFHEFELLDKMLDWDKGFFYFQYRCSVFHKKTGTKVGECVGSCNNKEKGRSGQDAYTTVNTIDKMAQKRAYVGAILSATRASAIFTQDVEDMTTEVKQRKPVNGCSVCSVTINDAVRNYSNDRYGKTLCMDCQKKEAQK